MGRITLNDDLINRLRNKATQDGRTVEAMLNELFPANGQQVAPASASVNLNTLELAADAVIIVDSNQKIVSFNLGAVDIFGYPPTAIIGKPLSIILPEDKRDIHEDHIRKFAMSSENSRHMASRENIYGQRKDGSIFPIEVSILKYPGQGELYFAAILRDMTEREEMTAKLREREATLSLLAENTTDMISLHAPDGTYLYVSPSSHSIFGYEPRELIGTSAYDYFFEDDLNTVRTSHDTALDGDKVNRITYRLRHKDGHGVWVETATDPVLNDDGEVVNLVASTREITERKYFEDTLQQERDLLARIMETSPSGISVVDRNGDIIFSNTRAEEILGYPENKSTSRTYNAAEWRHTDYDGNPWLDEQQPFVRVMQTKENVWDVRHAIEWSDDTRVYLSINGAPILDDDGQVSKVVFTIEDYTQRKEQQDELEASLARERGLNTMKSAFLSMVSHDFRTPLTVILSSVDLLRRKRQIMEDAAFNARLDKIKSQVKHLDKLIDEVTFINKDELVGHEITPENIDLEAFLEDISSELLISHPNHTPITVIITPKEAQIETDRTLMQKICQNLLSNALKYSPDESRVICLCMVSKEVLKLSISDEGIGIPESFRDKLFAIFQRADNVGTVRGTGLGLSIVQRAVDTLGGAISCKSTLNVGTTFTVTIPLDDA